MPAPDLLLLRHGETQWNREGRYQGQQDSPLSLTGIGQVRAVAETLKAQFGDLSMYQVWASPLARTRQSVSILCDELGVTYGAVHFDDRLKERNYGRWEGLTRDDITAGYADDLAREHQDRWGFAIPEGGESFADVASRLGRWLEERAADQPLIVMAHGGSGRVLRGIYAGMGTDEIFACNDPQSTIYFLENGTTRTFAADPDALHAFGCSDAGLGVRI